MRNFLLVILVLILLVGCASNVRFIQTFDDYQVVPKKVDEDIIFRTGKIERPHQVIGVIQAELGRNARKPQLDALIIEKAREIGADGLMMIEYDIDKDVYWNKHHTVVRRGPWKRHIIHSHPNIVVHKTASAIAVIFK